MVLRHPPIDMIRASPLTHTILIAVPIALAVAQLANSMFTGLSFAISVPFAIAMVGFTGILTQYNLASFRRRSLEREFLS